jgi:hypothetical protein
MDPTDPDMEYTKAYPDWPNSAEIAMQGAIARICHKYHQMIPTTSPYYNFGECSADGTPVDRTDEEEHSVCRSYLTEREFVFASTEVLLTKQVAMMDDAREVVKQCNTRVMQAEAALIFVDDKRKAMEKRLELLEEPLKMEKKMIESETWISMLELVIWETRDVLTAHRKEMDQLRKERDSLKLENGLLKRTVEELTAGKVEEDPEKRIMYTSDNEEVPVAEWKKLKTSE